MRQALYGCCWRKGTQEDKTQGLYVWGLRPIYTVVAKPEALKVRPCGRFFVCGSRYYSRY